MSECCDGVMLHVHAPRGETRRSRSYCPTCETTTRFVITTYEWYEPSSICCEYSDSWQGAEMTQRPFARGWRKRSMSRAERLWESAK